MTTLESAPPVRRRVAPLAPEDRRAALIDATLPLLVEHGLAVSTRQIAAAAGVAEGTIFRVFPDKAALLIATVLHSVDPEAGARGLATVDRGADLRTRLTEAARMLVDGMTRLGRLPLAMRELMRDPATAGAIAPRLHASRTATTRALADLIAPDAARLRVSPVAAARMMIVVIFTANTHMIPDEDPISPTDLVSVLLDGLLAPPAAAAPDRPATVREPSC